jgi:hypothetical protein
MVLLESNLEWAFVSIHDGYQRLLWCVMFKCLQCTRFLFLFSITKWNMLIFLGIMCSTWYFAKCHKLYHLPHKLYHLPKKSSTTMKLPMFWTKDLSFEEIWVRW